MSCHEQIFSECMVLAPTVKQEYVSYLGAHSLISVTRFALREKRKLLKIVGFSLLIQKCFTTYKTKAADPS